ncbi:unnamed protein product [Pedinophyceae sp. YPF-701]|nr:unnamed protein product [Pedinophyceae sp. YPF-701]
MRPAASITSAPCAAACLSVRMTRAAGAVGVPAAVPLRAPWRHIAQQRAARVWRVAAKKKEEAAVPALTLPEDLPEDVRDALMAQAQSAAAQVATLRKETRAKTTAMGMMQKLLATEREHSQTIKKQLLDAKKRLETCATDVVGSSGKGGKNGAAPADATDELRAKLREMEERAHRAEAESVASQLIAKKLETVLKNKDSELREARRGGKAGGKARGKGGKDGGSKGYEGGSAALRELAEMASEASIDEDDMSTLSRARLEAETEALRLELEQAVERANRAEKQRDELEHDLRGAIDVASSEFQRAQSLLEARMSALAHVNDHFDAVKAEISKEEELELQEREAAAKAAKGAPGKKGAKRASEAASEELDALTAEIKALREAQETQAEELEQAVEVAEVLTEQVTRLQDQLGEAEALAEQWRLEAEASLDQATAAMQAAEQATLIADELLGLEEQVGLLQQQVAETQQEAGRLEEDNARLGELLVEARENAAASAGSDPDAARRLKAFEAQYAELEATNQKLEAKLVESIAALGRAEAAIEEGRGQTAAVEARAQELQRTVDGLRGELDHVRGELQAEKAAHSEARQSAEARAAELQSSVDALEINLTEVEKSGDEALSQAEARMAELEAELDEAWEAAARSAAARDEETAAEEEALQLLRIELAREAEAASKLLYRAEQVASMLGEALDGEASGDSPLTSGVDQLVASLQQRNSELEAEVAELRAGSNGNGAGKAVGVSPATLGEAEAVLQGLRSRGAEVVGKVEQGLLEEVAVRRARVKELEAESEAMRETIAALQADLDAARAAKVPAMPALANGNGKAAGQAELRAALTEADELRGRVRDLEAELLKKRELLSKSRKFLQTLTLNASPSAKE